MSTTISTLTFDCYGTLIDSEAGAGAFLYDLALRNNDADPPPGLELSSRWEEIQFNLLHDYRPYKEILRESLHELISERGYAWSEREGDAFIRSMCSWQPFPDTFPALSSVSKNGIRLVIISNTDRGIIAHSLRHLRVHFDEVITAEDCHAYKPSPSVFEQSIARIGEDPSEILHVAFGFKYDIGPAKDIGMQTAWLNRRHDPPPAGGRPDHEWNDLTDLNSYLDTRGPTFDVVPSDRGMSEGERLE